MRKAKQSITIHFNCGDLNKSDFHRHVHSDVWSPGGGTVWEGLGYVFLLKEVCQCPPHSLLVLSASWSPTMVVMNSILGNCKTQIKYIFKRSIFRHFMSRLLHSENTCISYIQYNGHFARLKSKKQNKQTKKVCSSPPQPLHPAIEGVHSQPAIVLAFSARKKRIRTLKDC